MWFCLSNFLMEAVNQKLSPKMKMQYDGNERGYFALRAELEAKVILETAWLAFWQNCKFLNEPLENLDLFTDSELLTFNQILVESLKDFIDAHEENNEICLMLRAMHEKTVSDIRRRFPNELPDGDGFEDYLNSRSQSEHAESYRGSGERCIYCNGSNIHSKGDEWVCFDCRERHRIDKNISYRFSKHSS
jgi:hypothetical protein